MITRLTALVVPVRLVLQTMASTFFLHVHAVDVTSLHRLGVSPSAPRVLIKPSLLLALCTVPCVLLAGRRNEIPAKPQAAPSVGQDYIRHCRVPPPATTALLDMPRRTRARHFVPPVQLDSSPPLLLPRCAPSVRRDTFNRALHSISAMPAHVVFLSTRRDKISAIHVSLASMLMSKDFPPSATRVQVVGSKSPLPLALARRHPTAPLSSGVARRQWPCLAARSSQDALILRETEMETKMEPPLSAQAFQHVLPVGLDTRLLTTLASPACQVRRASPVRSPA